MIENMKKFLVAIAVIFLLVVAAFRGYLYPRLTILNGHAAKTLCSCVFVAGIPEEVAMNEDIGFFPVSLATKKVDHDEKSVTASFLGFKAKKAIFREGLGCAIFNQKSPDQRQFEIDRQIPDSLVNWFDRNEGASTLTDSQLKNLEEAMAWAFEEVDPADPKIRTRAVAIVYKGKLIGERYAPGFDKNSRLLGWSMTKSITAILYGILEKEGRLTLDDKVPLEAWTGDEKNELTLRQMLNMSSGMDWQENYADRSSVTKMLYESDNLGEAASKAKLSETPGTKWYYSSGTSNILANALSSYFATQEDYIQFPYRSLFNRLGMGSMIMETDASGHFVGSSYSWATARDWAKFGYLMINNGVFNGDTLINSNWVDFVRDPVEDSKGAYGGHFWLNAGGRMPDVPLDAYSCNGFHGQRVQIIPSEDLVIVRLGETYFEPDFDFNLWTAKVIEAISG